MSTEIEQVSKALAEFNAVEAGLAALRQQYAGAVFDVTSADGLTKAKAARMALREPRYEIERIRKSAKAPILALGRKLDDDAKRLTAEIEREQEKLRRAKAPPAPAVRRPTDAEIIAVVAAHFGVTEQVAAGWLTEMCAA